MGKDIKIDYKHYQLPYKIVVDGVEYPNHPWNLDIIAEYEATKDETVLDKLTKVSLIL